MNGALPPIASHLLLGRTGVLEKTGVAVVDGAVWRRAPEHRRNGFRHLAQSLLARLDRCCGSLRIIDVGIDPVPFDDGAGFVAQWVGTKHKPTVVSVEPTQTRLGAAALSGYQDPLPRGRQFAQVLGMDRRRPARADHLRGGESHEVKVMMI